MVAMSAELPAFIPAQVLEQKNEWLDWKRQVYPVVPGWVQQWAALPEVGLQVSRRQHLFESKANEAAQFANPWLSYLAEMAPYYGYAPESVHVAAVEYCGVAPLILQTFKVQDLTAYLPLPFCRDLFAVPFFRVADTPLVYCGVLEPSFIPYLEAALAWLRNRFLGGQPVLGTLPCVFQYFVVEPKALTVFVNNLERTAQIKGLGE